MIDKAQLDQAGRALSTLKPPGRSESKIKQSDDPTTKYVKSPHELWGSMLEKVEIFVSLVEKMGDVRQSCRPQNRI